METWSEQLHRPSPRTPLPPYLEKTVESALAAIRPSLVGNAPPASVLLIGPHGSGKSLLTERLLHYLRSQTTEEHSNLVEVVLYGLLHATPLRAWRHVAATLSDSNEYASAGVQECLGVISETLTRYRRSGTAVVFVLDEFDRFVTGNDGMSQTVLYSLLNFLQDRNMRIACVAMTACIDVTDGLEKRVKSRFVHREIVVPLPENEKEVLTWVRAVLLDSDKGRGGKSTFAKTVEALLTSETCIRLIRRSMLRTRVVPPILNAVDAALMSAMCLENPKDSRKRNIPVHARVAKACDTLELHLTPTDPMTENLHSLTELEIALLVSLRKLESRAQERDSKAAIVFSDVFRHYETASVEEEFSATKDRDRSVERGVAEKSWERLVECGLVVRLGHGPREMRTCLLAVAGEDVDRALQNHPVASSILKNWGKKR